MRNPNPEIIKKIQQNLEELLKTNSPEEISMRNLAQKCEISAANIYHYYKNKEELFSSLGIAFEQPQKNQNSNFQNKNIKKNGSEGMKGISDMMNYRPSIKVVDATLRDGGLCNDFFFPEGFAKALYEANKKAGVDYMEFGYKADKSLFDVNKFGPGKFCDDDYIRSVVGEGEHPVKVAVMADVGRCNFKEDIHDKSESPVDLIRIAAYLHQIPAAIEMIEDAHKKGYETSCNIMALSTGQENDIKQALDMVGRSPVDVIYIVDSYGSIYPEEMARVCKIFNEFAEKYHKKIGIHAHDNQKLAFANTIECVGDGVDYLDATYMQMGRGAGNCAMELLLGFLHNPKYKPYYVFQFIQDYMYSLKESGVVWGYDLQYIMTGLFNQHPRSAIAYTKDKRKDLANFYQEVMGMD